VSAKKLDANQRHMKSISCKEAVHLILRKEDEKISMREQINLWRHLISCSLCRIFSVQNNLMNEALRRQQEKRFTLSEDEKQQMIRNIIDEKQS
jgi:predicted anti-sigma-YlaC factor YlaD